MLVLVNAMYFKALWSRPFAAARTRDEDFATPKGTVKARMMRQMDYSQAVQYARIDNLQLVELPYVGQVSMIVFLPDDSDGLADVENRIGRSYDRWVAALTGEIVDLWLPRWTTTQGYFLDAALKSLGMPVAFLDLGRLLGNGGHFKRQLVLYRPRHPEIVRPIGRERNRSSRRDRGRDGGSHQCH
jgi:serpin B